MHYILTVVSLNCVVSCTNFDMTLEYRKGPSQDYTCHIKDRSYYRLESWWDRAASLPLSLVSPGRALLALGGLLSVRGHQIYQFRARKCFSRIQASHLNVYEL